MKSVFALVIASLACFACAAPQDAGNNFEVGVDEVGVIGGGKPKPPQFISRLFACPNLKLCQDPSIRRLKLAFQNIGPSGAVCVYEGGSSCIIGASGAVCALNGRVFQGNVIEQTPWGPFVIGC